MTSLIFPHILHPKGVQKASKMDIKSLKKRLKTHIKFQWFFSMVLEGFLFTFEGIFDIVGTEK